MNPRPPDHRFAHFAVRPRVPPALYRPADDPLYQPGPAPTAEDAPPGAAVAPDVRRPADRLPPGQTRTKKWPVLHAAEVPPLTKQTWSLTLERPGAAPLTLDWDAYAALPRVEVFADFHCVTRWSRLGTTWSGVSTRTIAALASWSVPDDPATASGYVIAGGADEVGSGRTWTTNLPLADFLSPHALLCDTADGVPLSADHGAPVRLIVPHLYAWKSAKWLVSLRLSARDEPGYWERLGYADRGDPWLTDQTNPDGERFRDAQGRRPDEAGDEAMMI